MLLKMGVGHGISAVVCTYTLSFCSIYVRTKESHKFRFDGFFDVNSTQGQVGSWNFSRLMLHDIDTAWIILWDPPSSLECECFLSSCASNCHWLKQSLHRFLRPSASLSSMLPSVDTMGRSLLMDRLDRERLSQ